VLADLEGSRAQTKKSFGKAAAPKPPDIQISLFGVKPEVMLELEKLDINALSPLEALNKLYELQQKAKG
jgi:DNA mismatch repair protein MutS